MRARGSARVHVGSALLLLVLWCAAAWLIASRHYVHRAQAVVAEATQHAGDTARNIARSVATNLNVMRGVPALVASQAAVQRASARLAAHAGDNRLPYAARKARWTADPALNTVSRLLDRIKASVGAGGVFLLDARGNCVASSDWGAPASRVGTDYSGRRFFREGLQRGDAAPLRVGGVARGVPVVTMGMPSLRFMISTDAGYISDANGVVVVAQNTVLLGHALPGAGVSVLPPRARRAIYGAAAFPGLRMTKGRDRDFPTLVYYAGDAVPYATASAELGVYGMTAHVRQRMTALLELDHNKTRLGVLLAALGAIDGSALVIEITEEEPVDDYPGLRQAMQPFSDRGFRFAVDDAGAGFASMRHVTELGPAFVKLDASLVRGMRSQVTLQAFLRAVNVFAAEIGATLIAEGVEETTDLAAMTRTGFPLLVQGYAIARPGPPWPAVEPAAHRAWIEQRGAHAPGLTQASQPPRIRGRHRPPSDRIPVESAVNIGVVLAASLHGAGIDDLETLRSVGSLAAWRRIRAIEPAIANERAIFALEGAVRGIRWSALSRQERARLIAETEGR